MLKTIMNVVLVQQKKERRKSFVSKITLFCIVNLPLWMLDNAKGFSNLDLTFPNWWLQLGDINYLQLSISLLDHEASFCYNKGSLSFPELSGAEQKLVCF